MKHHYFAGLALAALTATSATAQDVTHMLPKKPQFPIAGAMKAGQFNAPTAIDDKSKGFLMYACQLHDQSKKRSWIRWYSKDAGNFEYLKSYIDHPTYNNDEQWGLRFGAYHEGNDAYYAICASEFTFSFMQTEFVKVDIATGDTTVVRAWPYNSQNKTVASDDEQNKWYDGWYRYNMAYDYKNEVLYAMGCDYEQDETGKYTKGYSVIYEVNPETGDFNDVVHKFDRVYWDMCFDYDGNCYVTGVRPDPNDPTVTIGTDLFKFDENFNEKGSVHIEDEWGGQVIPYYFGGLSFDLNSGDIYWVPNTGYNSTVYKIDPETGRYTWVSAFLPGNTLGGLYIPYLKADNTLAPGRVSNLDAKAAEDGSMSATLTWTNPEKTWNRSELTELTNVMIYRKNAGYATTDLTKASELLVNSELVATLPATGVGAEQTWTDEHPISDINTYYVLATNSKGNGVIDSIRCQVGLDAPGNVRNISLERQGTDLLLSWEAPETGLHNGYIKNEGMTYKLTRQPDNVVVADGISETSFLDKTLGEQQWYSYEIQASNEKGAGAVTKSEEVMAGSALETPIRLTFESQADAKRWTIPSADLYFYYGGWEDCPDDYNALIAYGSYYGASSGLLVSPPLKLEGGKTYRLTTDFYCERPDANFDLVTAVGTSSDSQEGATVVGNRPGEQYTEWYHRQQYEDYFVAPETGTYYYSLKVTSNAYSTYKFFGLNVDYVNDNDMAALSIDNIVDAVAKQDNSCTVKVRNIGSKEQSGYTVKMLMDYEGTMVEVGSATATAEQTLKIGEVADVAVNFNPPYDDRWDFYAVVVADGDQDSSNDTTAMKTLNVLPEGSVAWTHVVNTHENEVNDAAALMWNTDNEEKSQALYYSSEIGAPAQAEIRRIGWIYDSNSSLTDRTNPVDVKVYLAHTDKTEWADGTDYIGDDDRELVYEGTAVFEPGKDIVLGYMLDTPFQYDNEQNLAVIMEKSGLCGVSSAAQFHCYNSDWTNYVRRTLVYSGGNYERPNVPVLYLGIYDPATGVESIRLAGSDMAYSNGTLAFGKSVKAEVYTVGGKLVSSFSGSSARLNLAKGLYIVRTTDANGQSESVKLNVK